MLAVVLFLVLGEIAIILQMALPDFYSVLGDRMGAMLPSGGEPQLYMMVLVAAAMTLGDWRALVVAVLVVVHAPVVKSGGDICQHQFSTFA